MKIVRKMIAAVLILFLFAGLVTAVGCSGLSGSVDEGEPERDRFLKTDGELIRNDRGEGDEVYLRGVNAGGLCVIECWMNGFAKSSSETSSITVKDHKTATKALMERFGAEKTQELWAAYRENWWSEEDFKNCAEMGMNVIRLPFTYMTVDFAAIDSYEEAGKNYDFSILDEFVEGAAKYGLYTILDLHGAYGSQNGKDHSGEVQSPSEVDFYSNGWKMALTADLWRATAEHFKDNPNVAAYDLLNEPAETTGDSTLQTEKRHWDFLDMAYRAVREVDREHICIFESCWDGANLPHPSEYGWENCMYSFHHYSGKTGSDSFSEHVPTMNSKIAGIYSQEFGVPIQMGEFTCYEGEESWEYTLDIMNRYGWHWCNWTYKLNNTYGNSPWGIVRVETTEGNKVNAHTDSYDTIISKFENLRTTDSIKKYTFDSGRTLWDLIKQYCTEQTEYAPVYDGEGDYNIYIADSDSVLSLAQSSALGRETVVTDRNTAGEFTLVKHASLDGTYYVKCNGLYLSGSGVSDKTVLAAGATGGNAARFYLWKKSDGTYALSSYQTGEYWYFTNEDSQIYIGQRKVENAARFELFASGDSSQ